MFRRAVKISREQALSARPLRLPDAQMKLTDGGGSLTVNVAPPRWARWLVRYPAGATRTFEFDSFGVFVWDCCDGRKSVQQIIRELAGRYKLNLREAEVSSLQFLQTLARKGLIGMKVEKKS